MIMEAKKSMICSQHAGISGKLAVVIQSKGLRVRGPKGVTPEN